MKKERILKIISLILVVGILIMLTIEIAPMFKDIATEQGRIELKNKIENMGPKGIFIIIGLMIAQIFLAILPGEPVEILAGMCYGWLWGLIIILIGTFISTFIIFFAVKKFGRSFIYSFASKERIEKIENSKLFSNPKTIDIIFFILFFIPGTPKDLFVYIGGLLPVKPAKFLIIATFARIPSIISSTIAGSNIMEGNWGIIAVAYAVSFILAGIIIFFVNKKDKRFVEVVK